MCMALMHGISKAHPFLLWARTRKESHTINISSHMCFVKTIIVPWVSMTLFEFDVIDSGVNLLWSFSNRNMSQSKTIVRYLMPQLLYTQVPQCIFKSEPLFWFCCNSLKGAIDIFLKSWQIMMHSSAFVLSSFGKCTNRILRSSHVNLIPPDDGSTWEPAFPAPSVQSDRCYGVVCSELNELLLFIAVQVGSHVPLHEPAYIPSTPSSHAHTLRKLQ